MNAATQCVICGKTLKVDCPHPWHLPFADWPAKQLVEQVIEIAPNGSSK